MSEKPKLNVKYLPVDALIPYARNARTHSADQVSRLAASIKEFGWTNPILIDGENGVIAGHGRLQAAQKLGFKEVPTIELSGLSETQKKAYILADNRMALDAGWDEEMLKLELDELQQSGYQTELTGFTESEIDRFLENEPPEENPYSAGTEVPQYEPKGDNPAISACLDHTKCDALIAEIDASACSEEEKAFLKLAAYRHVVFNYKNIAELYCHASKEMQTLMENSALVLIDFDDAMKKGFTTLMNRLNDSPKKQRPDDE